MSNLPAPLPPFSAQMVAELAAKIQPPEEVLDRYGVTKAEFATMKQNKLFQQAYREAKQFWESDTNAKDRIAIKAQVMVEDYLLSLGRIFNDADTAMTARMDAFGKLMKLAKVDGGEPKVEHQSGGGQAINININMGAEKVTTVIDAPEYSEDDE